MKTQFQVETEITEGSAKVSEITAGGQTVQEPFTLKTGSTKQ